MTSHLSVGVALGPVLLSLRHDGVCRPPVGLRNGFGQGPSAAHHHKLLVRLHPDLQQQRSHGRKQGGVWSSVRTRVQKKSGVRWSRSHAIRVSSVESLHTLVQSESSFSVPPLTMIFCLSGGTPVREKSCILKSAGGWSVSISTGYIPLCHFTWTASRRVARKKKQKPCVRTRTSLDLPSYLGWGFVSCHRAAGCRGHGVGRSGLPLMTPMVAWLRLDASPPSSLSLSLLSVPLDQRSPLQWLSVVFFATSFKTTSIRKNDFHMEIFHFPLIL